MPHWTAGGGPAAHRRNAPAGRCAGLEYTLRCASLPGLVRRPMLEDRKDTNVGRRAYRRHVRIVSQASHVEAWP